MGLAMAAFYHRAQRHRVFKELDVLLGMPHLRMMCEGGQGNL